MLEAIQMTFTIAPDADGALSRAAGPSSFRWVMIPGNEPTGDDRYVGITTVTEQQWKALARVIGRDDMADDDELGTMIGRFQRADEVNDALRAWTGAHTAEEIVAACVEARDPGDDRRQRRRAAALRPRDRARGVRAAAGRDRGSGPRAPFRFHGVPDRELAAPARGRPAPAWPARARAAEPGAVGERPLAGVTVLDFTAFWAGPAATAWLAAMGADVIKVEAVQRPDGIRFSAAVRPEPGPAVLREVGAVPRVEPRQARASRSISANPTASSSRSGSSRACDVVVENFTPRVLEQFGLDYDVVRAIRPDIVMVRMPAFGLTGPWRDRPGFAQTMEQITGMAWVDRLRGRPADHPRRPRRPDGRRARRARDRRRARAPRPHRRGPARGGRAARSRDRGDRRSGDPLLDRRDARSTGAAPAACTATLGDDDVGRASIVASDPMPAEERAAWCATRSADDAAAELRAAGHPRRGDGAAATRRSTIRSCGRAASSSRSTIRSSARTSTRRGRCACRPDPRATGRGPAPTLGQHTDEVLRDELGVTDDELARLRDEHVIGTTPYFG